MNSAPQFALPLHGLRVLDFSQFLAGPSAALRLADLGAEVIKVERPDGGDACRGLVLADQHFAGDSALFHTINRNKKSFAADLKEPADLAQVKALITRSDVMIHNFRPGVMTRLGLDADTVRSLNPRIVYAGVSGYGEDGPWRDKPGQDLLVQALSGLTWLSGDGSSAGDAAPVPMGVSVIDILTGAHLVQGILAALLRRGITGAGAQVDVSLLESATDLQFEPFTAYLNGDPVQPPRCETNHANIHAAAPYGIYRTQDGYLALAMTPMDRLARLVDCPQLAALAQDPQNWFSQRDALKATLQSHLLTCTNTHWLAILEPAGVWCAPVLDWPALSSHPAFEAVAMVQSITHASGATMQTTRCPIRIDGRRLFQPAGAPSLGADTQDITRELNLAQEENK